MKDCRFATLSGSDFRRLRGKSIAHAREADRIQAKFCDRRIGNRKRGFGKTLLPVLGGLSNGGIKLVPCQPGKRTAKNSCFELWAYHASNMVRVNPKES